MPELPNAKGLPAGLLSELRLSDRSNRTVRCSPVCDAIFHEEEYTH